MPGMDGFEVCRRVRDYVSCPILFLTARIEDADKVKGFSVGGDDYVVKPFSLMELEARIQAHLRREARHQNQAKVKFSGNFLVDYSERAVYVNGDAAGLAKRNLILWNYYLKMQDRFLIKKEFMKKVWGYDSEGDSSVVAEHIRRIRAKIGALDRQSAYRNCLGVRL